LSDADLKMIPEGMQITYVSVGLKCVIALLMCVLFAFFAASAAQENGLPTTSSVATRLVTNWRYISIVLFLAAVTVMVLREPHLLVHPRFWAEEGTEGFQYALTHSTIRTLTYIRATGGYFNAISNIAAVLSASAAVRFGLECAPAVTTWLALIIQTLAIALVLFGKSRLFDSPWKKIAGCLIVLFAPSATEEVWLNTTNSMIYLGLIAVLLAFEDLSTWPKWLRWGAWVLLAIAGLSGPYAASLLPVFLLSVFIYKNRESKIECGIVAGCLAVQLIVALQMFLGNRGGIPLRGNVQLDSSLVDAVVGHVVQPSLGPATTQVLIGALGMDSAWASAASGSHADNSSVRLAAWFCFFVLLAVLSVLRGRGIADKRNVVLGTFVILSALTCVASLQGIPLGRYAFLPGFCFLVLLMANFTQAKSQITAYVCMAVLSFGLANGMTAYWEPRFDEPSAGPSWSREVQLWRADHRHILRVWPSWWDVGISYNNQPNQPDKKR